MRNARDRILLRKESLRRTGESANLARRSFSEDGRRINTEEPMGTFYIEINSLRFPFYRDGG
jgi:hypothetical protein